MNARLPTRSGGRSRSRRAKAKRPQFPVVIKTEPDGTRVSTGKHVFGTTPLTLKLRPGKLVRLMFTKAGLRAAVAQYRFDSEEATDACA